MKGLRFLFAVLVMLSVSSVVRAQQEVRTAVGLRAGSPWSISAKQFFSQEIALEVMVAARPYIANPYSYLSVGGALQYYIPLDFGDSDFDGFHAYFGGGANVQFWNYNDDFFVGSNVRENFTTTSIRIAGYAGVQYALKDAPVEFTVDWSPSFNTGTTPFNQFRVGWYTLGVRYIIARQ